MNRNDGLSLKIFFYIATLSLWGISAAMAGPDDPSPPPPSLSSLSSSLSCGQSAEGEVGPITQLARNLQNINEAVSRQEPPKDPQQLDHLAATDSTKTDGSPRKLNGLPETSTKKQVEPNEDHIDKEGNHEGDEDADTTESKNKKSLGEDDDAEKWTRAEPPSSNNDSAIRTRKPMIGANRPLFFATPSRDQPPMLYLTAPVVSRSGVN